jgi:hypothetical protein
MWWWETVARRGGLLISEDATSSMLTVHMGWGKGSLKPWSWASMEREIRE